MKQLTHTDFMVDAVICGIIALTTLGLFLWKSPDKIILWIPILLTLLLYMLPYLFIKGGK